MCLWKRTLNSPSRKYRGSSSLTKARRKLSLQRACASVHERSARAGRRRIKRAISLDFKSDARARVTDGTVIEPSRPLLLSLYRQRPACVYLYIYTTEKACVYVRGDKSRVCFGTAPKCWRRLRSRRAAPPDGPTALVPRVTPPPQIGESQALAFSLTTYSSLARWGFSHFFGGRLHVIQDLWYGTRACEHWH